MSINPVKATTKSVGLIPYYPCLQYTLRTNNKKTATTPPDGLVTAFFNHTLLTNHINIINKENLLPLTKINSNNPAKSAACY